jgi:hypothetical protein
MIKKVVENFFKKDQNTKQLIDDDQINKIIENRLKNDST